MASTFSNSDVLDCFANMHSYYEHQQIAQKKWIQLAGF